MRGLWDTVRKVTKEKQALPFYFADLLTLNIIIFASVLLSMRFAHVHWCVTFLPFRSALNWPSYIKNASCVTLAPPPNQWLLHQWKYSSNCSVAVKCIPKRILSPRQKDYDFQWHFVLSQLTPVLSPYPSIAVLQVIVTQNRRAHEMIHFLGLTQWEAC